MSFQYLKGPQKSEFILTNLSDFDFQDYLKTGYYFKVIWARDRKVELTVDGYTLEISRDSAIFCTPENRIEKDLNTEGALVFMFNRAFYDAHGNNKEVSCNGLLFYGSSLPPVLKFRPTELRYFNLLYEMMGEEFKIRDTLQGEMLRTILKQILIISVRIFKKELNVSNLNDDDIDLIRRFNLLVEKHFKTKHKVKDYASLLNVSPNSLSNFFHLHSMKSPTKIISERISLEAQRLIIFSNKDLKEIAFHLGFNDASHFSNFFKKKTTYSPKEFRTKARQGEV